jgi:uncharacterized damage-inducible protein DinB
MSEVQELAEKLKSEGERFVAIFTEMTDDQWQKELYTEGATWTVRNVLAHFVTSERGLLKLFESIRQGGEGAAQDFSIDRYNAAMQERTKEASPQELVEQYRAVREVSIAWTSGLADADLDKHGRHPFLGLTTLREMIKMLFLHNQLHYRDIRKVLR